MPKEFVNDQWFRRDSDGYESRVRVSWWKEAGETVQIATIAPDGLELEPTPEGNGWFVNLDRSGINRLIRVLRDARDQAYGRDE